MHACVCAYVCVCVCVRVWCDFIQIRWRQVRRMNKIKSVPIASENNAPLQTFGLPPSLPRLPPNSMLGTLAHHDLDGKERFFSHRLHRCNGTTLTLGGKGGEHVIVATTIANERFFRSQRTPHVQFRYVCAPKSANAPCTHITHTHAHARMHA